LSDSRSLDGQHFLDMPTAFGAMNDFHYTRSEACCHSAVHWTKSLSLTLSRKRRNQLRFNGIDSRFREGAYGI